MDLNILNITNQNILILHIILFVYIYNVLWYIIIYMKLGNKLKFSLIYYILNNILNFTLELVKMYSYLYVLSFILKVLFMVHKVRYFV